MHFFWAFSQGELSQITSKLSKYLIVQEYKLQG